MVIPGKSEAAKVNVVLLPLLYEEDTTVGVADAGVTDADEVPFGPVPIAEIASVRKIYDVPFVKPVTVAAVAVEAVFAEKTVHVDPEFDEYSTLYPVIADAPAAGAVHVRAT